jgi:hypothetical protein
VPLTNKCTPTTPTENISHPTAIAVGAVSPSIIGFSNNSNFRGKVSPVIIEFSNNSLFLVLIFGGRIHILHLGVLSN